MAAAENQYKRVILVTGSNTGIGYDLVRLLAEKGHTVYLSSRNEAAGKDAQRVASSFDSEGLTDCALRAKLKQERGLDVKYVRLDITDIASVQAAKEVIEQAEGKLDSLVNNAGMSYMSEPQQASTISLDVIRKAFEPNFYGLIQTTQTFLPLLRASPKGYACILNVSTLMASNATQAAPGSGMHVVAYNTSKVAMNSYSIALAKELEEEGIKVNMISPGFISTKLNSYAPGGKTTTEGASVLVPWALLGPEESGKTCQFWRGNEQLPW